MQCVSAEIPCISAEDFCCMHAVDHVKLTICMRVFGLSRVCRLTELFAMQVRREPLEVEEEPSEHHKKQSAGSSATQRPGGSAAGRRQAARRGQSPTSVADSKAESAQTSKPQPLNAANGSAGGFPAPSNHITELGCCRCCSNMDDRWQPPGVSS